MIPFCVPSQLCWMRDYGLQGRMVYLLVVVGIQVIPRRRDAFLAHSLLLAEFVPLQYLGVEIGLKLSQGILKPTLRFD